MSELQGGRRTAAHRTLMQPCDPGGAGALTPALQMIQRLVMPMDEAAAPSVPWPLDTGLSQALDWLQLAQRA